MKGLLILLFLCYLLCKNGVADSQLPLQHNVENITSGSTSEFSTQSLLHSIISTEVLVSSTTNSPENLTTESLVLGSQSSSTSSGSTYDTTTFSNVVSITESDSKPLKCADPEPPELFYTDLRIYWNLSNMNCTPTILNITCNDIIDFSFTLKDPNYLDLSNETYGFERGTNYNCTAISIMADNTISNKSAPIEVPPGSGVIEISIINTNVTWTAPFDNQTLTYVIQIDRLNSNHYLPSDCVDIESSSYNFTTSYTFFVFTNSLSDYNHSISVSTEFWNNTIQGETFFLSPSSSPGKPRNISVEYSLSKSNNISYILNWEMPCDSNGKISEYQIQITDTTNSTDVIYETVYTDSEDDNLNLTLTNLQRNGIYNLEMYAVGTNNQTGEIGLYNFSTSVAVPAAPNVSITQINSTFFVIGWTIPDTNSTEINSITSFTIEITQIGPNYYNPNPNCSAYNPVTQEVMVNNITTMYTFENALPFFKYNVSVFASTPIEQSERGNISLITLNSKPEAPYNLTLDIQNNDTLESLLRWELPCNINGNMSGYQLKISEIYSEDNLENSTTNLTDLNVFELFLKPSHIYNISVAIVLDNGLEGNSSTQTWTTEVGFPGIPDITVVNITNTSFTIECTPPIEKTGPIQFYEYNITSKYQVYNISKGCTELSDSKFITVDPNHLGNLIYGNALPYSVYQVEVRANTARGYGNYSIYTFRTLSGVPENVRNIHHVINNSLSDIYNASIHIYFDPPCYSYGNSSQYIMEYFGTRDNFLEHRGNQTKSEADSWKGFNLFLLPEYNYMCLIHTNNYVLQNTTTYSFSAPAGVPSKLEVNTIPIESKSPKQMQIVLKKDYFSNDNGELRYISLLLSETYINTTNSIQPWDSMTWPNTTQKELTGQFWNPFLYSNEVIFTVGSGTVCNSEQGCNEPLTDDTTYYLTIRVFNNDFFRISHPISFRTDKISKLLTILGAIFGVLAFAFLGLIGFFIWKKKIYRKWSNLSQIYRRKSSAKPLPSSTTTIPTKKFIQYYKNTQHKPEILKEQFSLLAEKSKEIQSEKSCQFAALLENKRKNRYINISPYDDTRVKLLIDEDDEIGSDYINASYVKGNSGNIEYIATQGPLPTTCRDFWKMVIQENVSIIVMVSQFVENNKEKCYKYFPKNHENLIVCDDMEIRCSTELHFGTYLLRNLQVRKDSLQVSVTHMQFLEWPDFKVPMGTEHMLQFIYQLRERVKIEEGIIIVHCSAGVGRTGTLIAADMLLQNVNAGKQIDVFNTVLDLRKQRVMMVQTVEQYIYLHRLVADHIDRPPSPDLMEAADPVYENMDILKDRSTNQNSTKKKDEESQL